MTLRIVCLEEHLIDPDLAEAAKPLIARDSPYMHDLGATYRETPDPAAGRPLLNAPQTADALAKGGIEGRIAAMDAAGIDMQVLSYSNPAAVVTPDLARAANDRLAQIVRRHPDRFGAFSTLPWGDPQAAACEARRCADELGFCGSLIIGRPVRDAFLDDARFEPVLQALAETRSPLYVHPNPPLSAVQAPYYGGFNPETTARLSLYGWGWHNEAGVHVIRLILSGVLDRLPSLQLISGHWGEMVPFFLQRLDDALPPAATGLQRTIGDTYRSQVYVTPSGMLDTPNFTFCREVLGAERILFSLDYPYMTMTGGRAWLEGLPVPEDERAAIACSNAAKAFNRWDCVFRADCGANLGSDWWR